MDRTNRFPFGNVLCEEHNNQSTTDGYKSRICFLLIANWNTNKGWFDCLFVYPVWIKLNGKPRTAYTNDLFSVPFSTLRNEKKNENITDHIYIFLFCLWIRKKVRGTQSPFSYFLLWNRKTKNERTEYTTHGAFPFFHFFAKEKTKIGITDHISIFRFCLWIRKKENGC